MKNQVDYLDLIKDVITFFYPLSIIQDNIPVCRAISTNYFVDVQKGSINYCTAIKIAISVSGHAIRDRINK